MTHDNDLYIITCVYENRIKRQILENAGDVPARVRSLLLEYVEQQDDKELLDLLNNGDTLRDEDGYELGLDSTFDDEGDLHAYCYAYDQAFDIYAMPMPEYPEKDEEQ